MVTPPRRPTRGDNDTKAAMPKFFQRAVGYSRQYAIGCYRVIDIGDHSFDGAQLGCAELFNWRQSPSH
jgi:hypothetical protein